MTQNTDLLIYNGARVLPEHLIVQIIEHKNGDWDLKPKKEVKVTHIPTGLSASCMDDRSEHRNCYLAKEKLAQLLLQASTKTTIAAKVGEVYETRNGRTATVTSLIGGGYRCEHTNGMNYWHNAQGIANLGDIRSKNNLESTEFDLVKLMNFSVENSFRNIQSISKGDAVKKPIKWAKEAHAYIDGIEVEGKEMETQDWEPACKYINPITSPHLNWRIAVPQWRKNLAEKMRAGGVLEWRDANSGAWRKSEDWGCTVAHVLDPRVNMPNEKIYRIRPEPKPDVTCYYQVFAGKDLDHPQIALRDFQNESKNLKLIWDSEGKLKDAEVL